VDAIHPTIKRITAYGWAGRPVATDEPVIQRCCLEIGEPGEEAVDYFTLSVVNRAWVKANQGADPGECGDPTWLTQRATLLSDAPSFDDVLASVNREVDTLGPYATWPEFAKRMAHCMRWGLEGVLYPPFMGEA